MLMPRLSEAVSRVKVCIHERASRVAFPHPAGDVVASTKWECPAGGGEVAIARWW